MAFVKIDKGTRHTRFQQESEVRMGAARSASGRTIYIAISEAAIAQVGWEVATADDGKRRRISVQINEGVGNDAGFLLLTEDKEGYVLGGDNRSHSFSTNLMHRRLHHYELNDDRTEVEKVESTIDEKDHTILVQCPDWLRYNPQSYAEPDRPKPPTPPPPPPPEPPPPLAAKGDKKQSRPTVKLYETKDGEDEHEVPLNREQRRKIVATTARALRH